MKVCIVLGTRPELIKFTPIIEALSQKSCVDLCIINTGQHTDLLDVVPHLKFKENLYCGDGPLNWKLAYIIQHLDIPIGCHKPDIVLVQGDTLSALAGAIVASNLQIPVAHVEAGLRTYDRTSPFPEENYRRLISVLATYHFCISQHSLNNLMAERVGGTKWLTGSTEIDMVKRIPQGRPHVDSPYKNIVLTLHRRENLETDRAAAYLNGIVQFLNEHNKLGEAFVTCLWITHPNPKVKTLIDSMEIPSNMAIIKAATYESFIEYCQQAWVICSDSGGITELNTVLQRPLFILRDTTERPEVLNEPNSRLIQHTNTLLSYLHDLYINPSKYIGNPNFFYGEGNSGKKIANLIYKILC